MATIRAFTTIEQSRKLAEILPLESADMYYWCADHYPKEDWIIEVGTPDDNYECICAWSLVALLGVLPNKIISHETAFDGEDAKDINEIYYKLIEVNEEGSYVCCYVGNGYKYRCIADSPVDACVAMIEKLNELNLL